MARKKQLKKSGNKLTTDKIVKAGKRKASIAKATISSGNGIVKINKKPISVFNTFHQLSLREPFMLAEPILKESLKEVNIIINVKGGGVESQVEASRLAIARVIVAWFKESSQELREIFTKYDKALLVADTRRKEACKPNDSKARAKRQKSYR